MEITYCGPYRPGAEILVNGRAREVLHGDSTDLPDEQALALIETGDWEAKRSDLKDAATQKDLLKTARDMGHQPKASATKDELAALIASGPATTTDEAAAGGEEE